MGTYSTGKTFYYRMQKPFFHTLIIKSDSLFQEITSGPFDPKDTLKAKWSPDEFNKKGKTFKLSYIPIFDQNDLLEISYSSEEIKHKINGFFLKNFVDDIKFKKSLQY